LPSASDKSPGICDLYHQLPSDPTHLTSPDIIAYILHMTVVAMSGYQQNSSVSK